MREADLIRLGRPHEGDNSSPSPGPSSALGLSVPSWSLLEREILNDLNTQPPYGIGWWAPYPGTSRRILISDQLYCCTASVQDNLIEAALHWLEFLECSDRESDLMANVVRVVNGEIVVKMPRRQSPLEDLGPQFVVLHAAGAVRALSGALDCLAGSVVGVLALPTKLLTADFRGVRDILKKKADTGSLTEGERVQAEFGRRLEKSIAAAGAEGWLEWTLAFRNMLVHRGRRIEIGQFVPREPLKQGPDGRPIPVVRVVTQLPRDPGRSDIEVFLDQSLTPVLTEGAEQTLSGLVGSTRQLIEDTGQALSEVWQWRRSNPQLLQQPAKQWPKGAATESLQFSGYAPESFPYSPSQITTHPIIVQRMRAAALDDETRSKWQSFD